MAYGVMTLPALVIDGEVKIAGRLPSANELKGFDREKMMNNCCTDKEGTLPKFKRYILIRFCSPELFFIFYLEDIVNFLVYSFMHLEQESHLTEAIRFFLYDTPKVLMLLKPLFLSWGSFVLIFHRKKPEKLWRESRCLSVISWPALWVS